MEVGLFGLGGEGVFEDAAAEVPGDAALHAGAGGDGGGEGGEHGGLEGGGGGGGGETEKGDEALGAVGAESKGGAGAGFDAGEVIAVHVETPGDVAHVEAGALAALAEEIAKRGGARRGWSGGNETAERGREGGGAARRKWRERGCGDSSIVVGNIGWGDAERMGRRLDLAVQSGVLRLFFSSGPGGARALIHVSALSMGSESRVSRRLRMVLRAIDR